MTCTYLQTVDGDGRDPRHEPDEGGSVLRVDTVQQRHGHRQVSSIVCRGISGPIECPPALCWGAVEHCAPSRDVPGFIPIAGFVWGLENLESP